jgi:hypothetical protein
LWVWVDYEGWVLKEEFVHCSASMPVPCSASIPCGPVEQ